MILSAVKTEQIALLRIDGDTVQRFDTIREARVELIRCEREVMRKYPGAKVIEQRAGDDLTVCLILPCPKRIDMIRRAAEAVREERAEVEAEELMLEAS